MTVPSVRNTSGPALETLAIEAALVRQCNEATPFNEEEPLAEKLAELTAAGVDVPTLDRAQQIVKDRLAFAAWGEPLAPQTVDRAVVSPMPAERLTTLALIAERFEARGDEDAPVWRARLRRHWYRVGLATGMLYDVDTAGLSVDDETVDRWAEELNTIVEPAEDLAVMKAALDEARRTDPAAVLAIERNRNSAYSRYRDFVERCGPRLRVVTHDRYLASLPLPRPRSAARARASRASSTRRRGSRRTPPSSGDSDSDPDGDAPPQGGRE